MLLLPMLIVAELAVYGAFEAVSAPTSGDISTVLIVLANGVFMIRGSPSLNTEFMISEVWAVLCDQ
jgi:hypothetical protein